MKCDECDKPVTPRRARVVSGALGNSNVKAVEYTFCAGCHPGVFAAANWVKYPGLFNERREWRPDMAQWHHAREQCALLTPCPLRILSAKGFSTMWRAYDGFVFGIEYERAWCGELKQWIYRGIEP